MLSMMRLFVILVGALALAAPRAASQVHGRVLDAHGHPVAGARVELWSATRRLGAQETGPSGSFQFGRAESDSATGMITSRVGYESRQVSLPPGTGPQDVVIAEAAVLLEPVTVRGVRVQHCPNRDDPAARALWTAAAARYSSPDTVGIESRFASISGEVAGTEIGTFDRARLRSATRATGPQTRALRPAVGYGARLSRSSDEDYLAFRYYELGSHFTQHFVDPTFGIYNSISVQSRLPGSIVLAFCSRGLGREAVGIEGTLTIRSDTTMVSAAWRYRTPAPREEAGGEVSFVPHPGGNERPWLVSANSLYWRRLPGRQDRYYQRWEDFERWAVAPRMNRGGRPAARPQP